MSLFAAMSSGVSGLNAFSSAIGVTSDNIVNVNSVGYKASETAFSTLVTETNSNQYSPGGVRAVTSARIAEQGLLSSTGRDTDLAIDGAGMFVVKNVPVSGQEGLVSFTRAGAFTPDKDGYLRNISGEYLMGWRIESDGSVMNTGSTDLLEPVTTAGLTGAASPTTNISLRANLSSSTPLNPAAAAYDAADSANNMASGAITPDFTRDIQLVDAQGNPHTVKYSFLKSTVPNQWHVELHVSPPADVASPPGLVDGQVAVGTIAFQDGNLDLANTSASLQTPITFDWNNGVSDSEITLDLGTDGGADGFSQFNSASALLFENVDGNILGDVIGLTINDGGNVTAVFDNGLTQDVFRLALATFQNPDGLARQQGNTYGITDISGDFTLVEASTGGSGKVESGTLEASTVDLAKEFSDLIVVQRAYSASTRVITTADDMLGELVSIKR